MGKKGVKEFAVLATRAIDLLEKKCDMLRDLILNHDQAIDFLMEVCTNELEAPIDESVENIYELLATAGHRMTAIDTRINAIITSNTEVITYIKSQIDNHAAVIHAQNGIIDQLRQDIYALKGCGCKSKGKGAKHVG